MAKLTSEQIEKIKQMSGLTTLPESVVTRYENGDLNESQLISELQKYCTQSYQYGVASDIFKQTITLGELPTHVTKLTGAGSYKTGDSVTLTATIGEGYVIDSWVTTPTLTNPISKTNPVTFTMPNNSFSITLTVETTGE